jgi:hypothetical protein
MDRQVIKHDADQVSPGMVEIDQIAHAVGEVTGSTIVGDIDRAPWLMSIEEDEEVGRPLRRYSQS